MQDGVVPHDFKQALVTPLIKKKTLCRNEFKNYRSISNRIFLSKILERVVAKRLNVHKEEQLLSNQVLLLLPWLVPSSGVAGIADDLIPPCCPVCRVVLVQTHFCHVSLACIFPLNQVQSAYKRFHSSETALLKIHNDIICNMDNGKVTALTQLDLSAAFDTIDHSTLLERLYGHFGISGTVFK